VYDLYLKDDQSNPAQGDVISVDFFDGNMGMMNAFRGTTDANGHISFTYTAPADIADLNGSVLRFNIENTTIHVESHLTVSDTIVLQNPKLTLDAVNNKIVITQDGEQTTVRVYAFDNNNQPYSYGSIMVVYPDEVVTVVFLEDHLPKQKFHLQMAVQHLHIQHQTL
jgi:hypothetical protein